MNLHVIYKYFLTATTLLLLLSACTTTQAAEPTATPVPATETFSPTSTAAHHQGVIHRDLNPDNILMDGERNYFLTDFGIAKDLTDEIDLSL